MKALTTSDEKRTPEQEIKFNRLFEDAMARVKGLILKKVDPSKNGLQVLLEHGDEFVDYIVEAGIEKAREMTTPDQYSDEEVESSYEYPPEYEGPRPIKEQVKKLAEIFGLDPSHALEFADKILPTRELPNGAEGWFAIISPVGLEKLVPKASSQEDRYCKGVLIVLENIAASRRLHNYREGQSTRTICTSMPAPLLLLRRSLKAKKVIFSSFRPNSVSSIAAARFVGHVNASLAVNSVSGHWMSALSPSLIRNASCAL